MKTLLPLALATSLLAGCNTGFIDSDVERGLVGAAVGYGTARAIDGNGDRGAIIGGLAGVFCDDAGFCRRSY
ncbi:hypothetical protein [Jannaschia seohaensis]|uniref:Uncharacterized protein n=1 Tax=Jannaschia seohaensis TaxID=475081 RepID=A0A2Y9AH51_9RHOB|nr:hypothetical protein [Jannaschia seohaensis]PWJ21287.1 hypothetical protein BCF38_102537 [Jannaschia seohaensis]SSA41697.1 hypothetical protein SAMN05421539_102537 [Jannaschia seohaensis]